MREKTRFDELRKPKREKKSDTHKWAGLGCPVSFEFAIAKVISYKPPAKEPEWESAKQVQKIESVLPKSAGVCSTKKGEPPSKPYVQPQEMERVVVMGVPMLVKRRDR